jgi:hypothetical protein
MKDRDMNAPPTSEALKAYRGRLALEWYSFLEAESKMLPPKERRATRKAYLDAVASETEAYRGSN